ncbi:methyltransferase, partial [Colletotrichum filicis]
CGRSAKYDLIHSRVIEYIENWPEYLRNVQTCLAPAGVLNIEVAEMIPFTDEGSLPETSPLLQLSRILYEPSETSRIGRVSSDIGRNLNRIGIQSKLVQYRLPVEDCQDEGEIPVGDWLVSTMVKFIKAHVAIAREGPEQPQLDDRLVEAAKLEI